MENQFPESHESLWRRKLSPAERAQLRANPELEVDAHLTDALAELPNVPVPSNFTARVLDAIELEEARSTRAAQSTGWRWNWHRFLPRAAVTTAVLLFAGLGVHHFEIAQRHNQLIKNLSQVASTQGVPDVDALNNFDAIQRMAQSGRADTELLADLQ